MAKCQFCKKEMSGPHAADSCMATNGRVDYPDGTSLPASTEHFSEVSGRCHDCNIKHGGFHHPGCDTERCPKCGGQLISCGCLEPIENLSTIENKIEPVNPSPTQEGIVLKPSTSYSSKRKIML